MQQQYTDFKVKDLYQNNTFDSEGNYLHVPAEDLARTTFRPQFTSEELRNIPGSYEYDEKVFPRVPNIPVAAVLAPYAADVAMHLGNQLNRIRYPLYSGKYAYAVLTRDNFYNDDYLWLFTTAMDELFIKMDGHGLADKFTDCQVAAKRAVKDYKAYLVLHTPEIFKYLLPDEALGAFADAQWYAKVRQIMETKRPSLLAGELDDINYKPYEVAYTNPEVPVSENHAYIYQRWYDDFNLEPPVKEVIWENTVEKTEASIKKYVDLVNKYKEDFYMYDGYLSYLPQGIIEQEHPKIYNNAQWYMKCLKKLMDLEKDMVHKTNGQCLYGPSPVPWQTFLDPAGDYPRDPITNEQLTPEPPIVDNSPTPVFEYDNSEPIVREQLQGNVVTNHNYVPQPVQVPNGITPREPDVKEYTVWGDDSDPRLHDTNYDTSNIISDSVKQWRENKMNKDEARPKPGGGVNVIQLDGRGLPLPGQFDNAGNPIDTTRPYEPYAGKPVSQEQLDKANGVNIMNQRPRTMGVGPTSQPQVDAYGRPVSQPNNSYPQFNQQAPQPNMGQPQLDQYGRPVQSNMGQPQLDQYGRPVSQPNNSYPQFNQQAPQPNMGQPQLDQYGRPVQSNMGQPQLDQYGRPVGQQPQLDQYGRPVQQKPQLDQYGRPVGQQPQLDQYGRPVQQPMSQPQLDQYGRPVGQQPQLDQYGRPIQPNMNQPQQLDQYGRPIGHMQQPQFDQYGRPLAPVNNTIQQSTVNANGNVNPFNTPTANPYVVNVPSKEARNMRYANSTGTESSTNAPQPQVNKPKQRSHADVKAEAEARRQYHLDIDNEYNNLVNNPNGTIGSTVQKLPLHDGSDSTGLRLDSGDPDLYLPDGVETLGGKDQYWKNLNDDTLRKVVRFIVANRIEDSGLPQYIINRLHPNQELRTHYKNRGETMDTYLSPKEIEEKEAQELFEKEERIFGQIDGGPAEFTMRHDTDDIMFDNVEYTDEQKQAFADNSKHDKEVVDGLVDLGFDREDLEGTDASDDELTPIPAHARITYPNPTKVWTKLMDQDKHKVTTLGGSVVVNEAYRIERDRKQIDELKSASGVEKTFRDSNLKRKVMGKNSLQGAISASTLNRVNKGNSINHTDIVVINEPIITEHDVSKYMDRIKEARNFNALGEVLQSVVEETKDIEVNDSIVPLVLTINSRLTIAVNDFIKKSLKVKLSIDDFCEDATELYYHLKNNYSTVASDAYKAFEKEVMKGIQVKLTDTDIKELSLGLPLTAKNNVVFLSMSAIIVTSKMYLHELNISIKDETFVVTPKNSPMLFDTLETAANDAEQDKFPASIMYFVTNDGVKYKVFDSYFNVDEFVLVRI